jgi:hypothetical protein
LKLWLASKHRRNGGRFAAVAVMLFLWVAMHGIEASPDLHHLLHKDADSPGHHCLVTQFQQSQILSGFVVVITPAAPEAPILTIARCGILQFRSSYDYRLPPSRAPPAV